MMRHRLLFPIAVVFLVVVVTQTAFAQDLTDGPINKCGIHLNQPEEQDIKAAAALCNSSGGDWGWVALVVQEGERDLDRLNGFFNLFRKHHLVPIIRIATKACGENWCRPSADDAEEWASFLCSDKLLWPTDYRHIVLFNEPNQGKEWGGAVDPEGFADVVSSFSKAIKDRCNNATVMMAGFDSAAPQRPPAFMDEVVFLQRMMAHRPDVFDALDAWSSHSYANPGFTGPPSGTGRNSIANYEWELAQLRRLGVSDNRCVYITESGWPHAEGISYDRQYLPASRTSQYYSIYFNRILDDERVCAVTPFIINDQSELFDNFSWKRYNEPGYYPQYRTIQSKKKESWQPPQRQLVSVSAELPKTLVASSSYTIPVTLTNGGVAWWDATAGYRFGLVEGEVGFVAAPLDDIQPGQTKTVETALVTSEAIGETCATLGLYRRDELVLNLFKWCFDVVQPPRFEFRVGRFVKTAGEDFTVKIYDRTGRLVFTGEPLSVPQGYGVIEEVKNVVVGEQYKIVLDRPFHLPVSTTTVFGEGVTAVRFPTMIPVDFDNDGEFSIRDLVSIRERLRE